MSLIVTLMVGWRKAPLWIARDCGVAEPYETDEISAVLFINTALLEDIAVWDEKFQSTYRPHDPTSSGFGDENQWADFLHQGRMLARRLRQRLDSSIRVEYAANGFMATELIDTAPVEPTKPRTTYYAKIDARHPRNDPRGVVRRRETGGVPQDEAFTRNLRWEPTEYLHRFQLGHNDVEHVEISTAEADAFATCMRQKLTEDQVLTYWHLVEPEVAGQLGDRTVLDTSVYPPAVCADPEDGLEYRFADWLGDALIESSPVWLATAALADELASRAMVEIHPEPVTATADPEERDVSRLPRWRWLRITGRLFQNHVSISADHRLVVSQQALDILREHGVEHATVEPLPNPG